MISYIFLLICFFRGEFCDIPNWDSTYKRDARIIFEVLDNKPKQKCLLCGVNNKYYSFDEYVIKVDSITRFSADFEIPQGYKNHIEEYQVHEVGIKKNELMKIRHLYLPKNFARSLLPGQKYACFVTGLYCKNGIIVTDKIWSREELDQLFKATEHLFDSLNSIGYVFKYGVDTGRMAPAYRYVNQNENTNWRKVR